MRNIILLFISLFFVFISSIAFNKDIKVNGINKKVFIYPKKIINSTTRLSYYDKKRLELIEDSKIPYIKYGFITKMPGKAYVIVDYNKNNKKLKSVSYKVNIITNKANKNDNNFKLNPKHKPEKIINPIENNLTGEYSSVDKQIMKDSSIYYSYIVKLFNRRLYNKVLLEILNFSQLFPNDRRIAMINRLKGKTYIRLRQYNKAIEWYNKLIEKNDLLKKASLLVLLGNSYEKAHEFSKAKLCYIKVITLFKGPKVLADAHFYLGKIYFNFKENKMGIFELEELINKYPEARKKREIALYMLGEMYYKKSPLRDYKKSYYYFRTLKEEFTKGIYSKEAAKKMDYLKNNFIKYY